MQLGWGLLWRGSCVCVGGRQLPREPAEDKQFTCNGGLGGGDSER